MLNADPHPALLDRTASTLVLVDVQESFRSYVREFDALVRQLQLLVRGAVLLGVPVVVSEQYPAGLGSTVAELAEVLPGDAPRIEKLDFAVPLARTTEQLVVCGIETHVCVRHTVLAQRAAGRAVHVPVDAVGSRGAVEHDTGITALAAEGARLTSVEQVLFDWVGSASAPEFRDLQALLKEHAAGS